MGPAARKGARMKRRNSSWLGFTLVFLAVSTGLPCGSVSAEVIRVELWARLLAAAVYGDTVSRSKDSLAEMVQKIMTANTAFDVTVAETTTSTTSP